MSEKAFGRKERKVGAKVAKKNVVTLL